MASQAPEEALVKPDQPHKAVDDYRRHSEAASPTTPLNGQRDGNAKEGSPRVANNRKPSDQRTRRRRVRDEQGSKSNVPSVDRIKHRKSQVSRETASPEMGSRSNADTDLEWALVRYGTNLKEQDAEASHWHGTLVRKNGPQSFNSGLRMSSKKGDIQLARYCLDNGADIESKNERGQTSLHLAVRNGHEHLVLLLLERGADVEAAMDNGAKPLYISATQGRVQIAKLLLRAYANIESFNSKTQRTALCQAITNNHIEIVKLLLDGGVSLNTLLSGRNTPLYIAARNNNAQIVELLLEYGADKTIQLGDGSTVEDHIEQGSSVAMVLRQPPILKGPPFNARRRVTPCITFPKPPRPPAPDQYDKLAACHGFEATIVDFYLDHYQDEERRVVEIASIYDTLYERGPDRIMSAARGNRLQRQTAAFRWYHLPANNVGCLLHLELPRNANSGRWIGFR
jgi:ankyrin repeat protein